MRIVLILIATLAISGCLSTFEKPSDQLSDAYDGLWVADISFTQEQQGSGQKSFTCQKQQWSELLFIEGGQVGSLVAGPFLGHVDPTGRLLAKRQRGSFSSFGSPIRKPGEFIYGGILEYAGGEGNVMLALKGSTQGCMGDVRYGRIDPESLAYAAFAVEKQVAFSRGRYETDQAVFKGAPIGPNQDSSFVLVLPDASNCYGYWFKEQDSNQTGKWFAYCGEQTTVSGNWQFDGGKFEAQGVDSAGNKTELTGML